MSRMALPPFGKMLAADSPAYNVGELIWAKYAGEQGIKKTASPL